MCKCKTFSFSIQKFGACICKVSCSLNRSIVKTGSFLDHLDKLNYVLQFPYHDVFETFSCSCMLPFRIVLENDAIIYILKKCKEKYSMGTESKSKELQSARVYLSPSMAGCRQTVSWKNDDNLDSLNIGRYTARSVWLFERWLGCQCPFSKKIKNRMQINFNYKPLMCLEDGFLMDLL